MHILDLDRFDALDVDQRSAIGRYLTDIGVDLSAVVKLTFTPATDDDPSSLLVERHGLRVPEGQELQLLLVDVAEPPTLRWWSSPTLDADEAADEAADETADETADAD